MNRESAPRRALASPCAGSRGHALARPLALAALLSLAGGCQDIAPRALSAEESAQALEARTLADPELRSFLEGALETRLAPWPLVRWDLEALTLPLAAAGGVLGVLISSWLRGLPPVLSLGSLVGFVTVLGITTRNAIMMLSHFRWLVEREGRPWNAETARRGATDRVVPIVMTALVTGLGLLPIALAVDRPGGEVDGPMAIVILGGLGTSAALNLLLLPVLCLRVGRFAPLEAAE